MGWVNERLQGADDTSQNFRSKFLALKGSSVYIFSTPPVRMPLHLKQESYSCAIGPWEEAETGDHGRLQTSVVEMGPACELTTRDLFQTHKRIHFCLSVQTAGEIRLQHFFASNISWCGGGVQTALWLSYPIESSKRQSKQNTVPPSQIFLTECLNNEISKVILSHTISRFDQSEQPALVGPIT